MTRLLHHLILIVIFGFLLLLLFRPDWLVNITKPVVEPSKEWVDATKADQEAKRPEVEKDVASDDLFNEDGELDIALPNQVLPDLPTSLRATGFMANHSGREDLAEFSDVTPPVPAAFATSTDTEILSIVGGTRDDIVTVPWLVGLKIHNKQPIDGAIRIATETCGGGVYQRRWIVTAAHCVAGEFNEIEVIAGATDLTSETAVRRTTQRAFLHAGYDRATLRDDIAVIELAEDLPDYIQDAPWPSDMQLETVPNITNVIGRGFGITEEGFGSDFLKKVDLQVIEQSYRVFRVNDPEGEIEGLCQGDSGTPVTTQSFIESDDGLIPTSFIVGLVSYTEQNPTGENCANPGFVAGVINLEGYMHDIREMVRLCDTQPEKCGI